MIPSPRNENQGSQSLVPDLWFAILFLKVVTYTQAPIPAPVQSREEIQRALNQTLKDHSNNLMQGAHKEVPGHKAKGGEVEV
jgi:hypothetical protein